jgi:hypothetical protein
VRMLNRSLSLATVGSACQCCYRFNGGHSAGSRLRLSGLAPMRFPGSFPAQGETEIGCRVRPKPWITKSTAISHPQAPRLQPADRCHPVAQLRLSRNASRLCLESCLGECAVNFRVGPSAALRSVDSTPRTPTWSKRIRRVSCSFNR